MTTPMVGFKKKKKVTFAKTSSRMVKPRYIAGYAQAEEEGGGGEEDDDDDGEEEEEGGGGGRRR